MRFHRRGGIFLVSGGQGVILVGGGFPGGPFFLDDEKPHRSRWGTTAMDFGTETVRDHLHTHGLSDEDLAGADDGELYRIHDLYHDRGGDRNPHQTDRALMLECVREVLNP